MGRRGEVRRTERREHGSRKVLNNDANSKSLKTLAHTSDFSYSSSVTS